MKHGLQRGQIFEAVVGTEIPCGQRVGKHHGELRVVVIWGLALISMVWTFGMMALRKADIQEFFAETIRFFGTLG